MKFRQHLVAFAVSAASVSGQNCPGYSATNVQETSKGLTADLTLAGTACNTYGNDLQNLTLQVEYQTDARLHVVIQDADQVVYQVPTSVVARPNVTSPVSSKDSLLHFSYTASPFAFAISRSDGETLFNTSGSALIFQTQYLGLRTSLPEDPNIYGLGEHSDNFRANTTNYTRTLWSRDAYEIPIGTNLYGNHPIYFDHRTPSTHGVLLLNSNGMDVKINNTPTDGQYLEYNTLGGVFDFYFLAGPQPVDVASQYAEIVGLPVMMPYWGFGFHQCRYGYQDVYNVADVVYNYSQAGIQLETMWTDIDYMNERHVFTLDPDRFPLEKMRELVNYLHQHQQHYIMMVDPAVAYHNYSAFNSGVDQGIFLKDSNGSIYEGVVWPGPTAFPDWFHPDTQAYWSGEFDSFFNADTGVDIDALWIDMNEASNFCDYPCSDPAAFAKEDGYPPVPPPVRQYNPQSIPGFPANFQPPNSSTSVVKPRSLTGSMMGLPGRDLINPPYMIQNAAGSLSNKTLNTNLVHHNGLVEYDTHNMYGTMMSSTSRGAMLSRRPTLRPMVITRSTFVGAGTKVGHWLGDNESTFDKYRASISGLLQFASLYQVPMAGSDVCGYAGNTTETLCARWAMLGAFSTFYRDHSESGTVNQEFYRWATVTQAAKYAIDVRYRMLDYIYTALHTQTVTGAPLINPMFFIYPADAQAARVEYQYFFGDAVLVSPVTEENATAVDIYLPKDIFYDWNDGFALIQGSAANVTLNDVNFTTIPLHIRGGTILPLRAESANTTTELRKKGFSVVVATSLNGTASGRLYLDEGTLLEQPATSEIEFSYANNTFMMDGTFKYSAGVNIETITILGCDRISNVTVQGGAKPQFSYDASKRVATIDTAIPLTGSAKVSIETS